MSISEFRSELDCDESRGWTARTAITFSAAVDGLAGEFGSLPLLLGDVFRAKRKNANQPLSVAAHELFQPAAESLLPATRVAPRAKKVAAHAAVWRTPDFQATVQNA
jgi:hypothetical protein